MKPLYLRPALLAIAGVMSAPGWAQAAPTAQEVPAPGARSLAAPGFTPDAPCYYTLPSLQEQARAISSHFRSSAPRRVSANRFDNADGHDLREIEVHGELHALVIVVEFDDVKCSTGDTRSLIDRMLNEPGFSDFKAQGSARDFYLTQSRGQFQPIFDVYGPATLSKREVDYVQQIWTPPYDLSPSGKMVDEAVRMLDDQIDFSKYDSDGDGKVDFVYLFFAGKGATEGGNQRTTIWPHASTLTDILGEPTELDGVKVDRYATSAELGSNNKLSGIGTFCHEFGHVLGLPDLYDTANNGTQSKCFTPGTFDCMDGGNYNNESHSPALFSSYERYAMEWMKPTELTGGGDMTLLPLGARDFALRVKTAKPTEYFLLEARGEGDYDKYIEGRGLAVWHIDFDPAIWDANRPNNDAYHQRVDLVEADDSQTATSRDGDLFPGSAGICELQADGIPAFTDWNRKSTGFGLSSIVRHPDGCVSFRVSADNGATQPGAGMEAPEVRAILNPASGIVELSWEPVEGAGQYMVSVYDRTSFDGSSISSWADGWWFRPVGAECSALVEGLPAGATYGFIVYALSPENASRGELALPIEIPTADFQEGRPVLGAKAYGTPEEGDIEFSWNAIEGAASYRLEVGKVVPGQEQGSVSEGFDNSDLPQGWSGNGRFETRTKYCGQAAPSYNLNASPAWLQTAAFDDCIASVAFTCRQRFADEPAWLDIHSVDPATGRLELLERIAELPASMERLEVALPEGVRALRLQYGFAATGLDFFVDDIELTFRKEGRLEAAWSETVSGTSAKAAYGPDCALTAGASYVAEVTPLDGSDEGNPSRRVEFTATSTESGVGAPMATPSVSLHADGSVECPQAFRIFGADGAAVAASAGGTVRLPAHGLYVVVLADGSSRKIIW